MGILFISTHNLATNPRLVKEIELALKNNYEVSVLCCSFDNWSKKNNEEIKQRLLSGINYYEIPGNRKPFFPWLLSSFWFSLSKILLTVSSKDVRLLSLRSNKRSWLLLRHLKKIKDKIDLVVAHNPGSFYPAMRFAKKRKISFGIDLEDYHPGESNNAMESKNMEDLMRAILPHAGYVTVASESIFSESLKIVPFRGTVILNYFSEEEFKMPVEKSGKFKLVWFSQNISFNRGLEVIIPVIEQRNDFELHLFGNCNDVFKNNYLQNLKNVFLHNPLPQKELHLQLSEFDVGLAIEPGKDLNNQLAVSNKIIAYFQAGLYIVVSDTLAQFTFLKSHPEHGKLLLQDSILKDYFDELSQNKEIIRGRAQHRYEMAQERNWEMESQKLLNIWNHLVLKQTTSE